MTKARPLIGVDPIIIKDHHEIDYLHSYAQDSPFFAGLSQGRLLGTECKACKIRYATPRKHCMGCGKETAWFELPLVGKVHTWTTCYLEEPFHLVLVEFRGVDTFLLSRLVGPGEVKIGMRVRARFLKKPKFMATDVYFVPGG